MNEVTELDTMITVFTYPDVIARSEAGEKFSKSPVLHPNRKGRPILNFGGYASYDLNSLLYLYYEHPGDLCLDIGGRNHNGSPVHLSRDQLADVLNWATDTVKENRDIFLYQDGDACVRHHFRATLIKEGRLDYE